MSDDQNSTMDRRRHHRFEVELQVLALAHETDSGTMYAFLTKNVSESGLLLTGEHCDYPFIAGETMLQVALDMRELLDEAFAEDFTFTARVIRYLPPSSFGLEIVEVAPSDLERFMIAVKALNR